MDQCNEMDQCDEMEQDAVTTLCILLLSYVTKFIVQKGRFIFLNPIACNPSCYFSRTVSTNQKKAVYVIQQNRGLQNLLEAIDSSVFHTQMSRFLGGSKSCELHQIRCSCYSQLMNIILILASYI